MALTGNLEIFPLQEVLRMLARSNKTGCLRIDSGGTQGRVFISNGALTLATVSSDDEFRRQILNSGILTQEDLRSAELGGTPLTELLPADSPAASLTDFVREHVVESLYRIKKPGYGNFDFMVDMAPRYSTGQTFDAEVAVSEAERRAMEWADIETVLSDMNAPIVMVRELPDENNVTVNPPTWRVLSALGDGNSASGVADALGLSLFRAARELAGLVRNDLVELKTMAQPAAFVAPEPAAEPAPAPAPEPVVEEPKAWETPAEEAKVESPWDQPAESEWDTTDESAGESEGDDSADEGTPAWGEEQPAWDTHTEDEVSEPVVENPWADQPTTDEVSPAEQTPMTGEVEAEPASDGSGGWWAQAMGTEESTPADDDADAFLESVFSQLDESEDDSGGEDSEETGFSMGLLRRRRMGAVSKDITEG